MKEYDTDTTLLEGKDRLQHLAGVPLTEGPHFSDPKARKDLRRAVDALITVVQQHGLFHEDVLSYIDREFDIFDRTGP